MTSAKRLSQIRAVFKQCLIQAWKRAAVVAQKV